MAKAGEVKNTTQKDKAFAGSGVEGQKDKVEDKPSAPPEKEKAEDKPSAPVEKEKIEGPPARSFDVTGATSVVTHRNGLKRIWFRDGKEIGVEDAG